MNEKGTVLTGEEASDGVKDPTQRENATAGGGQDVNEDTVKVAESWIRNTRVLVVEETYDTM